MLQSGAHLDGSTHLIGQKMCAAASIGNTKRLSSYYYANANLNQKEFSGRTPLHFAVLHNKVQTIKFLLDQGVKIDCKDKLGQTPLDLAKAIDSKEAMFLLLHIEPAVNSTTPATAVKTIR